MNRAPVEGSRIIAKRSADPHARPTTVIPGKPAPAKAGVPGTHLATRSKTRRAALSLPRHPREGGGPDKRTKERIITGLVGSRPWDPFVRKLNPSLRVAA